MYRIEVGPGEETVFRTIEELAVAIRNGVVTTRARIYHHASEKWLPIGLHPHYKKALEMPAASASPAPVTSTTPLPTPSRGKGHPPSHPKPHSVVHFPEPKRPPEPKSAPEPKATLEPKPVPMAASAPKIPAPVQSPVIAMQNEVLRDLPVILIPEPLPWTAKRSPPVAPTVQTYAPAVDPPGSSAPAVHAPIVHASVTHAQITHAPVTHAPVTHAPVTHAPATHAPVTHAPVTHAPATHALVTHAQVAHAQVTHAQVRHAPATHAPVPRAPEPYRSMEYVPPVEEGRDADAAELLLRRPTARRSRRMRGRPLLLLGTAAALVVGTHLVLTATPSASSDPAEAPAPADPAEAPTPVAVAEREEAGQPAAKTSSAETGVTEARVTSAPARVSMIPGPAFAGSVPARPGADSVARPKVTAHTPAPAPAPAPPEPSISPAPAAIELALPGLPPDSIVPAARTGDTMGMKKILRALNGTRGTERSAAP
jgi:hypothetical protein